MRMSGAHVLPKRHQIQRWDARSNGQAQRHTTTPAHSSGKRQASDQVLPPFCWGKIFTFKNPDIFEKLSECKECKFSGHWAIWGWKLYWHFWWLSGHIHHWQKDVIHSCKTTPPDGFRILGFYLLCQDLGWLFFSLTLFIATSKSLEKSIHGWDFLRTGQINLTTWHNLQSSPVDSENTEPPS